PQFGWPAAICGQSKWSGAARGRDSGIRSADSWGQRSTKERSPSFFRFSTRRSGRGSDGRRCGARGRSPSPPHNRRFGGSSLGEPIRVLAFGAHPDDCEYRAGGTAALFAEMGQAVKFVSVTNGDAGHHEIKGPALAARRLAETREVARRLCVEYDVLDHPDGQLEATLEIRNEIIRLIREWNADLVLGPRPNDYHPDHRYTGILVQDAAF